MIEAAVEALGMIFSGYTIIWMILGILLGIFLGSLPGVGSSLGMVMVLPFTIVLDPLDGLLLLVSIYSGVGYGGCISAILINVPGAASAAASTFDGYPMSKQGRAVDALSISAVASSIGGAVTVIALLFFSPVLIDFVMMFGSPEFFLLTVFGLSTIALVAKGSLLKGIIAGFFGLLMTTIGIAEATPTLRYTFDLDLLWDGIHFVAVLVGIFAVAEMVILSGRSGGISERDFELGGSRLKGIKLALSKPVTLIKSAFIGTSIGAIPGAGASVSSFIAYSEAVRSSKDPDSFGEGNPEGLIASEAADNGTVAGSIIPTIAFGIPGSAATAVLLGGLIMHGLRPGPSLLDSELHMTYGLLFGLLLGNLVILIVGLTLISHVGAITKVDSFYIIPVVIALSTFGVFTIRENWIDIIVIVAFGILGFYMKKYDYSIIAFVLGFVLGPIAEENLMRSLNLSRGSFRIFIEEPLSLILVILTLLVLFGPLVRKNLEPLIETHLTSRF